MNVEKNLVTLKSPVLLTRRKRGRSLKNRPLYRLLNPGKPDTYEDIRGIVLTFGRNARLDSSSAALLLLGR